MRKLASVALWAWASMGSLLGQTTVGAASVWSTDCYQITPNANSQSGAVWFPGPVDITSSFEMTAQVYLGTNDGGADGNRRSDSVRRTGHDRDDLSGRFGQQAGRRSPGAGPCG